MILQEFIPGDDTHMRVMTSYSDRQGRVRMMCLGHVLLEEHSPHGIGNHAVILTDYDAALSETVKTLLNGLHYTGFRVVLPGREVKGYFAGHHPPQGFLPGDRPRPSKPF